MLLSKSTSIAFSISSLFLICISARGDFGTGTITFDEASYQLYYHTGGTNFVPYTSANRGGAAQPTGVNGSGVITVTDDQIIPYDAYFQSQNSNGDSVYVRFAFDVDGDGVLESTDTPAVFEGTYSGTADERGSTGPPYVGPNDTFAYTSASGGVVYADYIESGYESQAGSFFVRARKDYNSDGTQSNDSGDQENWTSFIIDYAGADVTEATGEIWDIDAGGAGAEKFTVTVSGDSASVTDGTYSVTEISPTGLVETNASSLDGKPWQFSFSSSDGFTDIDQIKITRFSGAGYKSYFPLAFNNFNPVSSVGFTGAVPEPSTLAVFAVGSIGVVAGGIRRRRKQKA